MLTVRGLIVEVGGKTIVDGASLQVRPGDKVGLVGRNGAGKTTLAQGPRRRGDPEGGRGPAGVGLRVPVPGPPRRRRARRHDLPRPRALGARARRPRDRIEKLRIALEEDPSSENIERFSEAQERFEAAGGYAAESEVRKLAAGVGLRRRPARPPPRGAVGR